MSVIHSWSGPPRRNSRRTRSNEVTVASLEPFGSRLVGKPLMPRWRMISETALWPTAMLRPCLSSAVTLSAPYVPPEALWTSAISPASQMRRNCLGDVGRSFQA